MATLLKVLNNLADIKSAGVLHFALELRVWSILNRALILTAGTYFRSEAALPQSMEGIAAAKLKGAYKGRPASIDAAKVAALKAEGLGATEIAKRLKVGRASVYRLLAERRSMLAS